MNKLDNVRQRVAEMKDIAQKLKSEFFSIDKQIEQITEACIPFYATPEMLTRPLVVCLWGPTGVGKTDLVRKLVEAMGMGDSFVHFDMGEYASGYGDWNLRYSLESLANTVENGRAVIVFDEMQTVRCIDETGREVDRPATRLLWEVLDSGTITKREHFSNYPLEFAHELERCVKVGVEVSGNKVTARLDEFQRIVNENYIGLPAILEDCFEEDVKTTDDTLCVTQRQFERLYQANPAFFEGDERWDRWSKELFEPAENLSAIIDIVRSIARGVKLGEPKSLQNSLVFCLGNLDEVFEDAHSANPDQDIELLRAQTEKVSLSEVKEALMQRFRAEQIARFGNNHVVYPSLDRVGYEKIIETMLARTQARAQENFGIQLGIDVSVRDLIFRESVFPTQGARSVGTSFSALADTYLSHAIYGMSWEQTNNVLWKYDVAAQEYVFESPGEAVLRLPVQLRVDGRRQSDHSEMQAVTAVHEAGHAVICMVASGTLPREVRSRTGGSMGGYLLLNPREFDTMKNFEDEITLGLGGYAAEKLVFGADHVSLGSSGDYNKATGMVCRLIRQIGLHQADFMGAVGVNLMDSEWAADSVDQLTQSKMTAFAERARLILEAHMPLLADLSQHLAEHPVAKEDFLLALAQKHGVPITPEFSHRAALRDFHSTYAIG